MAENSYLSSTLRHVLTLIAMQGDREQIFALEIQQVKGIYLLNRSFSVSLYGY